MGTEIILKDVGKYFGKKQALKNVNLNIEKGMFGLLGRNGAGKTTLMKCITTILPISEGSITVCGKDIKNSGEIRSMIGYLPQDFSMYGGMTVYEAMDYLGVLSGLDKKTRKERIPELLEKVNLSGNMKTKVKAMSGGMKRRLGIAQAILHHPKVLIVDEPTAGLDPEERVRFRNLLSEIAGDRIVILSTHIASDIEATCENVAVLDEGEIIYTGTVTGLIEKSLGDIYEARISRMELDEVKRRYIITNMITMGTEVGIRFINEGKNDLIKGAALCSPNVEDAYMYLMHKRDEVR